MYNENCHIVNVSKKGRKGNLSEWLFMHCTKITRKEKHSSKTIVLFLLHSLTPVRLHRCTSCCIVTWNEKISLIIKFLRRKWQVLWNICRFYYMFSVSVCVLDSKVLCHFVQNFNYIVNCFNVIISSFLRHIINYSLFDFVLHRSGNASNYYFWMEPPLKKMKQYDSGDLHYWFDMKVS